MKRKILSILLVLAACLPFVACEDELDIEKKGSMGDQDTYYVTDEAAEAAISSAYYYWFYNYNGLTFTANMLSDDIYCGGSDAGDDVAYHDLNNYNFDSENTRIESDYADLYRLIYSANLVIEKVGNFSDANPETAVKRRCVAEAYFFRGFAHFWLAAFWGNAPVVTIVLDPKDCQVKNSQPGECMEQAAKDIKHAIDMNALKTKSGPEDKSVMAYVTHEAAKAMLGKVYMFQEKWGDAAKVLEEVITSQKYDLYRGQYQDIIKSATNWSCEGVLETQAPSDATDQVKWAFMTYICISPGWRNDAFNWNGLNGIVGVDENGDLITGRRPGYEDFNISGYGFCNPRKGAYDAFVQCEGASGYRLNSVIKTSDFVQNDMKLKLIKYLHGHDQYFNWKNRFLISDMVHDNGGWNIFCQTTGRYMRYAEVLLNAAESHFRAGNAGRAKELVNEVRDRAQATPYPSVTLEQIKLERRCELYNEHNRWFDLVRWGEAANVLKDQGKITLNLVAQEDPNNSKKQIWSTVEDASSNPKFGFRAGVNERLPYPAKECRLNPNVKQNPGY